MKRTLFISAILLLPLTGAYAGINPFKPYKPLKEIDYSLNWSLGKDPSSIAYKPYTFTEKTLMPIALLSTSILYNDNYLDKRIVKQGKGRRLCSSPPAPPTVLTFLRKRRLTL